MTAQVIIFPPLLEELLADAMDEVASCEADIDDLTEGRTLPEQYGPEFACRDGRDLALEALDIALGLARARVERLLDEHGCPDCRVPSGKPCLPSCGRIQQNMGDLG